MKDRKRIQDAHEKAVITEFIVWLNGQTGKQYVLGERPDPPDAILHSGDETTWVEHADIYRSADEAHEDRSFAIGDEPPFVHRENPICEPDTRIAKCLIQVLEKKLQKSSYRKIYEEKGAGILLLTLRDPLFDDWTIAAIEKALDGYRAEDDHGFFEFVVLGIWTNGGMRFAKIYPPE